MQHVIAICTTPRDSCGFAPFDVIKLSPLDRMEGVSPESGAFGDVAGSKPLHDVIRRWQLDRVEGSPPESGVAGPQIHVGLNPLGSPSSRHSTEWRVLRLNQELRLGIICASVVAAHLFIITSMVHLYRGEGLESVDHRLWTSPAPPVEGSGTLWCHQALATRPHGGCFA